MKNLVLFLTLFALIGINGFYTKRLIKFARESSKYFTYLELKTNCLESKSGMNKMDARLASFGLRREKLKGRDKIIFPVRHTYDTQDEGCRKYAEYMCWNVDPKNPANIDHCNKELLDMGYTKEQIDQIRKTKSFLGIYPK